SFGVQGGRGPHGRAPGPARPLEGHRQRRAPDGRGHPERARAARLGARDRRRPQLHFGQVQGRRRRRVLHQPRRRLLERGGQERTGGEVGGGGRGATAASTKPRTAERGYPASGPPKEEEKTRPLPTVRHTAQTFGGVPLGGGGRPVLFYPRRRGAPLASLLASM